MEAVDPNTTPNSNDVETALKLLKRHREHMMRSYHKNKDKRLAYAKSYYQKKKEKLKKEEEGEDTSSK